MTKETTRRIHAYRHMLPDMKKRVLASVLVLAIALITTVTSSYAWLTISRSPVVSQIATTLSANGNLEIALSKDDGSEPDEFDIDESQGIQTDVTVSNLQWGNLINLADDSYGLESLALRPARLNQDALLTSPLWGAVYGSDGRITTMDTHYAYVKSINGELKTSNTYGVRAIASYTSTVADSTQQAYDEKVQAVTDARTAVNNAYANVPGKFSALSGIISTFAQDKLNSTDSSFSGYLGTVIPLYEAVYETMIKQKDVYVALANLQLYVYDQNNSQTFTALTWDDLVANKAAYSVNYTLTSASEAEYPTDKTSTNGVVLLVGLTQFISDLTTLEADLGYLKQYKTNYDNDKTLEYKWSSGGESGHQIGNIVSDLVDQSTMEIDLNNDGNRKKITSLSSSDASALMGAVAGGIERKVYVCNGILVRLEQQGVDNSLRLQGKGNNKEATCTIKVKYSGFTATINGLVYTDSYLHKLSAFSATNFANTTDSSALVGNDQLANDTYGMVVDVWVRTNAEQTCLTLEGATTVDEDKNIISYDGVNRVWGSTGKTVLTTDSTTQGGGSCYIYYADTPEDAARSLSLLKAMKVAFVDQSGNLLATASMDTENYYAVNGRYTVPLVLDTTSQTTYTYTDSTNQVLTGRAITTLYTDVPVRLETIVYLDGDLLTNDDVLAAAEIQGQLNLQFGSSTNLTTVGNNSLMEATRSVSATLGNGLLSKTMDYDTAVTSSDLSTDVFVEVEGADPATVQAFFVRAINSTQGTRESTMTFTKLADGSWSSSYTFLAPGTYYLRYVRLDGVDYALSEPCKVEVSGFAITSVSWGEVGNSAVVRTSDSTYTEKVAVKFSTNDSSKMPSSVQAQFEREDGAVTVVTLRYQSSDGSWSGTATFNMSGVYTLKYLVLDKRYTDLESRGYSKTLDLSLGMYVSVSDQSGVLQENYESGQSYSKDVSVKIYDNSGRELTDLTDVTLLYANGGSAANTLSAPLTWDEWDEVYTGTLPIVKAGRYVFSSVKLGDGNYLKKTKTDADPPVYTIISPDPPEYVTTSQTSYSGDNIQFVPLTNDAIIDGVRINNAEAASASAVVFNTVTSRLYTATMAYTGAGNQWVISLPTYQQETGEIDAEGNPVTEESQDGTWSVVALCLWDCYYNESYCTEDDPLVWLTDNTDLADQLLESLKTSDENGNETDDSQSLTAAETFDFSALSTTVSGSVKVNFTAGTTALGSSTTPFGTVYTTDAIGMQVLVTDGKGHVIPAERVGDVTLNISYTSPTNAAYGYAVTGQNKTYVISLGTQDSETGARTVTEGETWKYVGEYKVTSLTVTVINKNTTASKTLTFTPQADTIGLPVQYTLTTAAPTADNVKLSNTTQGQSEFGITNGNITGTFLDNYSFSSTYVQLAMTSADGKVDMSGVVMDGVSVTLDLNYQGGSEANGGYTINGDSAYKQISVKMNQSSNNYFGGSTPLLAGTYTAQITVTINGTPQVKSLKNITVYSQSPTVKITGVTPDTSEPSFKMNTYTGPDAYLWSNGEFYDVQNYYTDSLANVYIGVTENLQTVGDSSFVTTSYTLPKVELSLSNAGNFSKAELVVPNNASSAYESTYTFTINGLTQSAEIGGKETKDIEYSSTDGVCSGSSSSTYSYDVAYYAGSQTLSSITLTDNKSCTYTVSLSEPITIRETNNVPASLSYVTVDGYQTFDSVTSKDGGSLTVTLPTAVQFGTTTSEQPNAPEDPVWVLKSSTDSKYYYVATNGEAATKKEQTGGNSCTGYEYTTYYYYDFNYYEYTRTQTIYETTITTDVYNITTGLVGWQVGDITYTPGETITVSGALTATPVLGSIGTPILLRTETVTMRQITVKDVCDKTETKTGDQTTYTNAAAAKEGYTVYTPSGYSLYNADDAYDNSWVTTDKKIISEGWIES